MKILSVNKNTIDVFFNKGWDEHARFKINRTHQSTNVFQVMGQPVSKATKQDIIQQLRGN